MNHPKKPARWQLDVWLGLMIFIAVLIMQTPVPDAWMTLVQIAWCVLTIGGMGLWVWTNRLALRDEEQEQHRTHRNGTSPSSEEPAARTLPLTVVQQHFLAATGQPVEQGAARTRDEHQTSSRSNAHATRYDHDCALASMLHQYDLNIQAGASRSLNTVRRAVLGLLVCISIALTTAGALMFLVLVGDFITPFWSRIALVLYGLALVLAAGIYRYCPSWRLLLYPLVLMALIYLWDSTLPPPSLPDGRVRLLLPLFALGGMVFDGGWRLWRVVHLLPRTIYVEQDRVVLDEAARAIHLTMDELRTQLFRAKRLISTDADDIASISLTDLLRTINALPNRPLVRIKLASTASRTRWLEQSAWPSKLVGCLAFAVAVIGGMVLTVVLAHRPALIAGSVIALFIASFLLLGALGRLRVGLSATTLSIQLGLFREHIPLQQIVECSVRSYQWQAWGGFGRHHRGHVWLYNVPRGRGLVVLQLDDGRRVLFSSSTPRRTCAAIRNATSHAQDDQ